MLENLFEKYARLAANRPEWFLWNCIAGIFAMAILEELLKYLEAKVKSEHIVRTVIAKGSRRKMFYARFWSSIYRYEPILS